jgi:hypothetical protein
MKPLLLLISFFIAVFSSCAVSGAEKNIAAGTDAAGTDKPNISNTHHNHGWHSIPRQVTDSDHEKKKLRKKRARDRARRTKHVFGIGLAMRTINLAGVIALSIETAGSDKCSSGTSCSQAEEDAAYNEFREELPRRLLLFGGINALVSSIGVTSALYFLSKRSEWWEPSFGPMLFGSVFGAGISYGLMAGMMLSGESGGIMGLSLGVIAILFVPTILETVGYNVSVKPHHKTQETTTQTGFKLTPPMPTTIITRNGRQIPGLMLVTLSW